MSGISKIGPPAPLTHASTQSIAWIRRPRHNVARCGAALAWVVVIVMLLCVFAIGLHRWKIRIDHRLAGPVATLDLGKDVSLELVRINPGQFMMGSPDGEPEHDISEAPMHRVTISNSFYMGRFEITQAQWNVFSANQSHSNVGDDFPADGISWNDASNWCKAMSARLGMTVRLPTEAEWEYACRAGTTTAFSFGPTLTTDEANFNNGDPKASIGKTSPVGSFKPNAWGLFDMHGNVWEWCQDTLHDDYEKAPTNGSAWVGSENRYNRVRRGGSWADPAGACRSAVRWGSPGDEKEPNMRNDQVGFRVVVEPQNGK